MKEKGKVLNRIAGNNIANKLIKWVLEMKAGFFDGMADWVEFIIFISKLLVLLCLSYCIMYRSLSS